jgi:hypothetical protein
MSFVMGLKINAIFLGVICFLGYSSIGFSLKSDSVCSKYSSSDNDDFWYLISD